jgi:hypothetical protein
MLFERDISDDAESSSAQKDTDAEHDNLWVLGERDRLLDHQRTGLLKARLG